MSIASSSGEIPPKRSVARLALTAFVALLLLANLVEDCKIRTFQDIFNDFGVRLPLLTVIVIKCRFLLLTINSLSALWVCYMGFWRGRRLSFSKLGAIAAVGIVQGVIVTYALYSPLVLISDLFIEALRR